MDLNTYEGRQKFYHSKAWQSLRQLFLYESPLCVNCLKKGKLTSSYAVDHIIDISKRPDLALNFDNLQALCKSCHDKKTFNEHMKGSYSQSLLKDCVNRKWDLRVEKLPS